MQIIGFNFEKIHAERKNPSKDKIEISSNINISSITEEKTNFIKDQEVLKFNFDFSVDYKTNVAEILFQGFVLLSLEKGKAKEIIKKWKTKKLSDDVRIPLFNFILTKSNIKALHLSEELNLPPHIPMPKIKPAEDVKYTG